SPRCARCEKSCRSTADYASLIRPRYASSLPPSVTPLTYNLPAPGIEHQASRLADLVVQERKARVIAGIDKKLIARHRNDCDRCTFLKIENGQRTNVLDQQIAILDGDLKIGPCSRPADRSADNLELDRRILPLARDLETNRRVNGPAHFIDRLVQVH